MDSEKIPVGFSRDFLINLVSGPFPRWAGPR